MPFTLGDPTLHWEDAAASATAAISTVDIPVSGGKTYRVVRQDRHGREYGVLSHAKLIVAMSHTTGEMATYIRVCIPDEMYADFYDGNICDMTLNCDDRVDYCGLEYYATIDGRPVAVARYDRGRLVDNVFIADSRMTPEQRLHRFSAMMGGTWIIPATDGTTRAPGDYIYGPVGTTFWGTDGNLYIYIDNTGDGKADGVTLYSIYLEMLKNNTDFADNGGGSTNSGGNSGNTGSPGGNPAGGDTGSPGNSGNSGGFGGGGSGNGNGNNNNNNNENQDDENKDNKDEDENGNNTPIRPIYPGVIRNPNIEPINPIPGYTPIACPKCGQCPCVCPKSVDCDKLYPNFYADKVAADLNYRAFDCKMSEFLNAINNSNYEYNMTLSEKDGAWSVDGPTTSHDEKKVYVRLDYNAVASMHN
ncbi:MAG: hypothetical protein K2I43_04610, partial [Alistipes sp.]|nr:hypothetical protein [Alistipes sp.]